MCRAPHANLPPPHRRFFLPAVMRVRTHRSKRHHAVVSLNRSNLLLRDGYACQYCGSSGELTIDHVVPQARGEGWAG